MTEQYRQEHKFLINRLNLELLRIRLPQMLKKDPHAGPDGSYLIRSLYFDDTDKNAFRDKLDGVNERVKYRIRIYNGDSGAIFLEKKERNGSLCRKASEHINRETAEKLSKGLPIDGGGALLNEFCTVRTSGALRPSVIVDYRRFAFYTDVSHTRVTLDTELATPAWGLDLFGGPGALCPVFRPDEALIELKYDTFAPPYVLALLEGVPKVKISVSKYVQCLSLINE